MCARTPLAALLAVLATVAFVSVSSGVTVPANFAVSDAAPGAAFNTPTGIAFFPDGRFLVTEKRGRVYEVRNGVKQSTPIWSREAEVLDESDRGLLGIAIDPKYFVNHYIYLLYVVDPDSNGVDDNTFGFDRLTRYQVNFTDSTAVVASSRTILMGVNRTSAPASISSSHAVGSLRWGRDGSLLVSVGDGAHWEYMDRGGNDPGAFGSGLTDPFYDIGAFRAQDITSLNGKVLRLNPANGRGYASNPYTDGNLGSARSRVWCYGMRNPFRFNVRPGTGSTDTSAANPGTLYIGDVGWETWEELNVARTGGVNFGWPCYEGIGTQSGYQGASPAHNGCGSFGSATNPTPARSPLATWHHSNSSLSVPPGFFGNCTTGGVFYTKTQYPAQYRNQFIFGDFGQNWIRLATVDVNDNLVGISSFIGGADGPVDFATDPLSGDVFYVAINVNLVRRIRYTGVSGNAPPVASISATPLIGTAPLSVAFSSAGSYDPDADPITTTWAFLDGSGSTSANPTHVYTTPGVYNVQLTVSDNRGGSDIKYITITVNLAASAFPSTPVLDNFNRANGSLGSPWVDQPASFTINGNVLAPLSGDIYTEWNGATFGPDQEAYLTLSTIAATAPEQNLMLKTQGTAWTAGHIEVSYFAIGSRVIVYTYAPSAGWQTAGTLTGVTYAAGDQFGARALGNGSVLVYRNGALVGSVSVAGWPFAALGGRIGISTGSASAARFDNFGGGNIVSNVNTPPVVTILTPADNAFYYEGQTINLTCSANDSKTPSDSLAYAWVVDLYHNNHVHPSTKSFSTQSASFVGVNYDDGTGVHLGLKLTASDPQGAVSDTARATLWPETDLSPSAVTVTPDPPTAGQSAHFTFTLGNSGRMPAPISHWVLRAGGTTIAQGDAVVPATGSVALSADAATATAGNLTLRLTADSLGVVHETNESNNASVRALTVNPPASNTPPVAVATGSPTSGTAPLLVSFSGAASTDANGDSLTFAWAFGDGGTATGRLASHTYASAGSYAAILTVTDGRGGSDTASVAVSAVAPASGFPQNAVLDNFNRVNGAVGGSWIDQTASFSITTNVLAPQTGEAYIEWNGASFAASQEAFVTLSASTGGAAEQNLMLKTQGTTWTGGHIEVSYSAGSSNVTIYTYTPPGVWKTIGTINGVTFAAGNQFGARALADGTVQVYKNGALIGSASVAGWAYAGLGGRIGVSVYNAAATRFDDFGGGTVTGALALADPAAPMGGRTSPTDGALPGTVALSGAFPNPTSGGVSFSLALPVAAEVGMSVLDIQGRQVWSTGAQHYAAGRWALAWDGKGRGGPAPTGVYLALVRVGTQQIQRRIALIR